VSSRTLRMLFCAIVAGSASMPLSSVSQTLFTDDLNDNSAGWVFTSLTGKFGITGSSIADYGFDYAALGIPEAPNFQAGNPARQGLRIRTNNNGLSTDQAVASLTQANFTGKYTVQVDLWLNWAADTNAIGTTLHGGLYVGDDTPARRTGNLTPAQRGAGAIFSTDGDCSNCDFILQKNQYELDTFSGQYRTRDFGFGNQPGYDNTDFNTNPANGDLINLPTVFPAFDINAATSSAQGVPAGLQQTAGAIGFQWVTLTAEVDTTRVGAGPGTDPGIATFSLTKTNGQKITIGTVDNSVPDDLDDDNDGDNCDTTAGSEDICVNGDNPLLGDAPVAMNGRIGLFLVDFFTGASSDLNLGFGLYDNVKVFVTPSAAVPGDYNGNGTVGPEDYTLWSNSFGGNIAALQNVNPAKVGTTVDASDFTYWRDRASLASVASAGAVPEPAAAAMLLTLLAGIGLRRFKS
jgi:hypothetical protein